MNGSRLSESQNRGQEKEWMGSLLILSPLSLAETSGWVEQAAHLLIRLIDIVTVISVIQWTSKSSKTTLLSNSNSSNTFCHVVWILAVDNFSNIFLEANRHTDKPAASSAFLINLMIFMVVLQTSQYIVVTKWQSLKPRLQWYERKWNHHSVENMTKADTSNGCYEGFFLVSQHCGSLTSSPRLSSRPSLL